MAGLSIHRKQKERPVGSGVIFCNAQYQVGLKPNASSIIQTRVEGNSGDERRRRNERTLREVSGREHEIFEHLYNLIHITCRRPQ